MLELFRVRQRLKGAYGGRSFAIHGCCLRPYGLNQPPFVRRSLLTNQLPHNNRGKRHHG
jgi:hypothetical protein